MNISVDGWRGSLSDWKAVKNLSREQLRPLTSEQQAVARKLGIPEEEYARTTLLIELSQEKLLAKAKRFARLLEERLRVRHHQATIEHILLNTWQERFEIEITINQTSIPLRVEESLVERWLESGSAEAEQALSRILDLALQMRVS